MKVTIEIPDELYRRVKAKSALEGQPVREVVMRLFQGWLGENETVPDEAPINPLDGPMPAWFGAARSYAKKVKRHDLTSIRRSIARGRGHESMQPPSEGLRP